MRQTEHRSFNKADEVRRWSNDAKPIAKTDSCTAPRLWVVGDETVVVVDWSGDGNHAK